MHNSCNAHAVPADAREPQRWSRVSASSYARLAVRRSWAREVSARAARLAGRKLCRGRESIGGGRRVRRNGRRRDDTATSGMTPRRAPVVASQTSTPLDSPMAYRLPSCDQALAPLSSAALRRRSPRSSTSSRPCSSCGASPAGSRPAMPLALATCISRPPAAARGDRGPAGAEGRPLAGSPEPRARRHEHEQQDGPHRTHLTIAGNTSPTGGNMGSGWRTRQKSCSRTPSG